MDRFDRRETMFITHTADTAPAGSKPIIVGAARKFGYVPAPVARMAASPELLGTFMANLAVFDRTTLTELEREIVVMTMATHVECHYCVAMHSATLAARATPAEVIDTLRDEKPLADNRLEALRRFTLAVLATHGGVSEVDTKAFLDAGYTQRAALEVVLGIGTYTLSTFANRLTGAPLDPPFEPYRWPGHQTGRNPTG
ncbi:carboxymuconolactone decarboxylase family protein [Actinokineospora sp.]|uniref:carboxymuconolactone decarboxylase family protein n=1 Tax=Actinokineospora sp. TaxID=1872133 RepID=UPI0040381797